MTQVNEDLRYFDIEEIEEEITKMKRDKFKEIVDKKIRIKASENLTKLQMKHSKSMYLYQNDVMAEYLTTHLLSVRQKQLLFRLRSRTTPNKTNYRKKYENNLTCSLCKKQNSEESLGHFLECNFLLTKPHLTNELKSVKEDDIYKPLPSQIKAVKLWAKVFRIYESVKSNN